MYFSSNSNLVFIFIILICYCWCNEDHSDHDHEKITRSNVIEEIFEHIGVTTKSPVNNNETVFQYKDIQNIFDQLHFKNCSENETSFQCNLCFNPADVFTWLNYSKTDNFTEENILPLSQIILFLLINNNNISTVCKTHNSNVTLTSSNIYNLFTNKYGRSTNGKFAGETGLEKILHDIENVFGKKLTNKECFSAHNVISSVNASETEFSANDFAYVSAFVIFKLLKKSCISDHKETTLPSSTSFISNLFTEFGVNSTHMSHDTFEKLVKQLKLGSTTQTAAPSGDGHNHRKKRFVETSLMQHRYRRSTHDLKKCYSGENLLTIFKVPEGTYIDTSKFQEMCPALVQQLESGACATTAAPSIPKKNTDPKWKPWIGMVVSIAIVSLASLVGVFATPFTNKKWFPFFIMFLIALAVGTLVGDSIMHLLPHSLNLHKHDEGAHSEKHGDNEFLKSDSFLWKCVMFLAGIFIFFTFEIIMHAFGGGHSHSHDIGGNSPRSNGHVHHISGKGSLTQDNSKKALQVVEGGVITNEKRKESFINQTPSGMLQFTEVNPIENEKYQSDYYTNQNNSKQFLSIRNFKSVVWMILIGDAVHNFMDGIAIGVAFSEEWPSGLHGGISTSIAIFCHELPHELGDFAVLLSSGLSIKQALLMNFISSLSAFIGGIVGVSLGTTWNATPWIFALTSGLFIYIALADMFPEALHSKSLIRRPWLSIFLLDFGLLLGFAILFVLAAWEEDLKSALK